MASLLYRSTSLASTFLYLVTPSTLSTRYSLCDTMWYWGVFFVLLVWRSSKLAALPYMPVLSHSMGISLVKVSTSGIWTPADTAQYGTIHHDM